MLTRNSITGTEYAVKIFKKKKSLKNIKKEYSFLKRASDAGIAPKIIPNKIILDSTSSYFAHEQAGYNTEILEIIMASEKISIDGSPEN